MLSSFNFEIKNKKVEIMNITKTDLKKLSFNELKDLFWNNYDKLKKLKKTYPLFDELVHETKEILKQVDIINQS